VITEWGMACEATRKDYGTSNGHRSRGRVDSAVLKNLKAKWTNQALLPLRGFVVIWHLRAAIPKVTTVHRLSISLACSVATPFIAFMVPPIAGTDIARPSWSMTDDCLLAQATRFMQHLRSRHRRPHHVLGFHTRK